MNEEDIVPIIKLQSDLSIKSLTMTLDLPNHFLNKGSDPFKTYKCEI